MKITSDNNRPEMIFRTEIEGKKIYSIGLTKKNDKDEYERGYIKAIFKKNVNLENKTRILMTNAWLGFNTYNKKTFPYIFINDFEIVDTPKEETPKEDQYKEFGNSLETPGQDIRIELDEDSLELPF